MKTKCQFPVAGSRLKLCGGISSATLCGLCGLEKAVVLAGSQLSVEPFVFFVSFVVEKGSCQFSVDSSRLADSFSGSSVFSVADRRTVGRARPYGLFFLCGLGGRRDVSLLPSAFVGFVFPRFFPTGRLLPSFLPTFLPSLSASGSWRCA